MVRVWPALEISFKDHKKKKNRIMGKFRLTDTRSNFGLHSMKTNRIRNIFYDRNNKVNSTILIFKGYGGANGQKTADLGDELQSVKHTAKLLIIVLFIF